MIGADEGNLTRWWRPLSSKDRWALFWMAVIPTVLFVVPALLGHPAIDQDNLIQNFPLRVLVGRQIASGHLPLLNQLANAGTPLLGGMNAGALYPLTLIFVFVPAIAAWVINLIAVYVVAAVGFYALLRWHGLRESSSFVAALTYAYSGAMIGQIVHLGVVQGFSFLPWVVLVLLGYSKRLQGLPTDASWRVLARASVGWLVGFAVLCGLTGLTGEPRAIASVELLCAVGVPAILLLRSSYQLATWRTRVTYVVTLAAGAVWGAGLALMQLLPGWSFIKFSERSSISYTYFGAGSLAVRWTALLLDPTLFGGNGALHQSAYFANYNLAEVTGYAGVIALMALFAFLTRLTRRGWRGEERDYTIYVVLFVVGLLATWGAFTPLGHLFHALPLYGSTRLQSRNVIFVDFAMAALLGWWLEQIQRTREERPGLGARAKWVTFAPALAVAVLSVALLGWGRQVVTAISISDAWARLENQLDIFNTVHLLIALGAVAVAWLLRRSPRLFTGLVIVLAIDLLCFNLFAATGLIGGPGPTEPSRAAALKVLGTEGRFALVDVGGYHTNQFRALGEPNMNVFTRVPSVQGYGSLISTVYDDSTGTHPTNWVNACHLWEGTFTQLRLATIAIAAELLARPGNLETPIPVKCRPPLRTTTVKRYFGALWRVDTITLEGVDGAPISLGPLTLRLLNDHGQPLGATLIAPTGSKVRFNLHGESAAGFILTSSTRIALNDTVVTTSAPSPASYQLDTNFQLALAALPFTLREVVGTYAVFHTTSLLPKAWLATPSSGTVTKVRISPWGDAWVSVNLNKRADLKRTESYLPGWRATAHNDVTGKSINLPVRRVGLIQMVSVPPGRWTIHFHYHAPYLVAGTLGSAVSLAALALLALYEVLSRRRAKGRVRP